MVGWLRRAVALSLKYIRCPSVCNLGVVGYFRESVLKALERENLESFERAQVRCDNERRAPIYR